MLRAGFDKEEEDEGGWLVLLVVVGGLLGWSWLGEDSVSLESWLPIIIINNIYIGIYYSI
jgi:hypothetical protein